MKKRILTIVLMMITALSLAGCGKDADSASGNNSGNVATEVTASPSGYDANAVLFTVEGYDVTTAEFNQYLIQSLSCFQVQSPEMSDDLKKQFITETMDEIRLELIVEKLALDSGTVLSDEAKKKIDENVYMFTTYYGDTILKEYNIDESLVRAYFNRVATIATYEQAEEIKYADQYMAQIEAELDKSSFCSFDVITFESADNAAEFKKSVKDGMNYQDMLSEMSKYSDAAVVNEKGIYGGFEEQVNEAIENLDNNNYSDVVTYNGKPSVIVMKNREDEEFYNQTVRYIATETAKQLYSDALQKYINENNFPEVTIDQAMYGSIDPQNIYARLCDIEQSRQQ